MTPAEIVRRWLRLVMADAELSPYLIGVDVVRLAGQLTASVAAALAGEPADAWVGSACPRRSTGASVTTWSGSAGRRTCPTSGSPGYAGRWPDEGGRPLAVGAVRRTCRSRRWPTSTAEPGWGRPGSGAGWADDSVAARVIAQTALPRHRHPDRSRLGSDCRYLPGQAVPVSTPHAPGRWRWYSPPTPPPRRHHRAARPRGPVGTVSVSLAYEVRPGDCSALAPLRHRPAPARR